MKKEPITGHYLINLYTPLILKLLYLYIIFVLAGMHVFSQNIFDREHSEKYAEHLFINGKFIEASKEYERLLYIVPRDTFYSERLISAYIRSDEIEAGIQIFEDLTIKGFLCQTDYILKSYLYMLLQKNDVLKCKDMLTDSLLSIYPSLKDYYVSSLILSEEFEKARDILYPEKKMISDSNELRNLYDFLIEAQNQERKNPVLAAVLSAVIPGTGKAYANDFMNGAKVFFIITLYSFQSYRAYHIGGGDNIYTWLFGSGAVIFYSGNVYGSYKSAKRVNDYEKEKLRQNLLEFLLHED